MFYQVILWTVLPVNLQLLIVLINSLSQATMALVLRLLSITHTHTDGGTPSVHQKVNHRHLETINHGYEFLVKCGVQVSQDLSRDPKSAALLLHSEGFISDRLLEEITDFNVTRSCEVIPKQIQRLHLLTEREGSTLF